VLIAELAERQHGLASLTRLQALALTDSAVRKRVTAGRLRRIHRGVYAVGHGRLTAEGRVMAAVLACVTGGEGLADALKRVGVVVDVTNTRTPSRAPATEFSTEVAGTLQRTGAERCAGHIVTLSIVRDR
jgi:hypothetical protein